MAELTDSRARDEDDADPPGEDPRESSSWVDSLRASTRLWAPGIVAGGIGLYLWGTATQDEAFGFNAAVCLTAAVYMLARAWLARGVPPDVDTRLARGIRAAGLGLLVVAALMVNYERPTERLIERDSIRTWNIYHYYMGSKYFDELGYHDLYIQTILADREDHNRLDEVRKIRDLTDYEIKRVGEIEPVAGPNAFSEARWSAFKRDLAEFTRRNRKAWRRMLVDRGYNPTPFWNTIGNRLSESVDIRKREGRLWLTGLDPICYALMFGLTVWAFGLEAALLLILCFALLPFNLSRIVGGYIQYDWMAAIVAGVCLLRKQKPIAASIAFGFAILSRVFPLLLLGGLAYTAGESLWRKREISPLHKRGLVTLVVVGVIGLFIGTLSGRGMDAWREWQANISLHNHAMTYGSGRVGLKHFFTQKLGEYEELERIAERMERLDEQFVYYVLAALVMGLLLALALRVTRGDNERVLLSMVAVFILLVPSHYYWSILALLVLWRGDEEDPWWVAPSAGALAFVSTAEWYRYAETTDTHLAHYLHLDLILALGFTALTAALVVVGRARLRPVA